MSFISNHHYTEVSSAQNADNVNGHILANVNKSSYSTCYYKITHRNPVSCAPIWSSCARSQQLHNTLTPCSPAKRGNNPCWGSLRLLGSCISLCTCVRRSHPCPLGQGSTATSLTTRGTTCSLQPSEDANAGSGFRDACNKGSQARTSFSKLGISPVLLITVSGQGQKK